MAHLCVFVLSMSVSMAHPCVFVHAGKINRSASLVQMLKPYLPEGKNSFATGPALFGPILGVDMVHVSAELEVVWLKDESLVGDGCQIYDEEKMAQVEGKVVMVMRGGCLFVQKVRKRVTEVAESTSRGCSACGNFGREGIMKVHL